MKNLTITLFAILAINFIMSCSNDKLSSEQKTSATSDSTEIRLGESNYYLRLSDNFTITEARGKEGQLGYNIIPKDSTSQMSGFIEIEHGRSKSITPNWGMEKYKIPSSFLGQEIAWTVYETETGYFVAATPEAKVTARATSNKRDEIDSLISIISTLRKK